MNTETQRVTALSKISSSCIRTVKGTRPSTSALDAHISHISLPSKSNLSFGNYWSERWYSPQKRIITKNASAEMERTTGVLLSLLYALRNFSQTETGQSPQFQIVWNEVGKSEPVAITTLNCCGMLKALFYRLFTAWSTTENYPFSL